MTPERTPEGKYTLYRVVDGQPFVRWPVDAVALLATGAYTTDPLISPASADAVSVGSGDDAPPAGPAAPEVPAVPADVSAESTPRRRRR